MALQSSGPIEASDIRDEFGATNGTSVRFGNYKISQTVSGLINMPLDAGIPQSGPIKFSDFYGKKLNVVVDYTSPTTVTRVNARSSYDANNNIVVIGNFRGRPASPAGTKVWIHTNGVLGSDQKSTESVNLSRFYSSLLTGSWDSTTDLKLDVGPSGLVCGSGGDGGNGGNVSSTNAGGQGSLTNGTNGKNGTTAIGVQHAPISVTNRGTIRSGGGGGGGGGSAWGRDIDRDIFGVKARETIMVSGSGGGGGRGLPAGSGGSPGTKTPDLSADGGDYQTVGYVGNIGNAGTSTDGGNGGNAAGVLSNGDNGAAGGAGGGGTINGLGGNEAIPGSGLDSIELNPTVGTNATTTQGGSGGTGVSRGADGGGSGQSSGGSGGLSGFAIVVNNGGAGVSITNTGTISGDIQYNAAPV